jgi:hypothetical protein
MEPDESESNEDQHTKKVEIEPEKTSDEETEVRHDAETPTVDPLPGTIELKQMDSEQSEENSANEDYIDDISQQNEDGNQTPPLTETEDMDEKNDDLNDNKATNNDEDAKLHEADVEQDNPQSEVQPKNEINEKDDTKYENLTPIPENYTAVDSLPDPGQKKAEELQENMQEPMLYDTKEYYVPIGKAHHSHGGIKGAFIFGAICAVIVLLAFLYFMYIVQK